MDSGVCPTLADRHGDTPLHGGFGCGNVSSYAGVFRESTRPIPTTPEHSFRHLSTMHLLGEGELWRIRILVVVTTPVLACEGDVAAAAHECKYACMDTFRFSPVEDEVAPFAILNASGELVPGSTPMSDEEALEALELMLLARSFDEKATSLQRQGRFGTFSSVRGQEASIVGAASAMDPSRDWVVPQYRELPALLRQGFPLENFALYFMGHPAGGVIPEDVNVLPIQISLAAQLPQAVGLAWGLKKQGSDGVVTTFFGDGASSEGDFHESLNLAGLTKAPVIFFLQNNGWAISTPRRSQSATRTFAERAPGYGVEGVYVDGNDLFAVHAVVAEAVDRARLGGGATLIESLTWRAGAHNTADDPTKYLSDADHEPWSGSDPITRVQTYLTARNVWTAEIREQVTVRCREEIDRALRVAQATPAAGPEALFDHVFASPPARLQQQRKQWMTAVKGA